MSQFRVLVTCPPMQRSIDRYRELLRASNLTVDCPQMTQVLTEGELCELLPNFDGWIIGDDPATARVFQAGKKGRLRAAVKWGVGVDNVDLKGAADSGFTVKHTPGMFGEEVADIALGYIIGLARETFFVHHGVTECHWPKPCGISLRGKTVGIFGFGNIGQCLARRVIACGMDVTAYDPYSATPSDLTEFVARATLPDDIESLDFVVLCCALTSDSLHLVNQQFLSRCKDGVRIVNVSRGGLIDESALYDALANSRVHSAALEVFETEPLPAESRLRLHPQCLFGSHNASNTQEAVDRTSHMAIELLSKALSGTC